MTIKGSSICYGPFTVTQLLNATTGIQVTNNAVFNDELRVKKLMTLDYDLRCAATIYSEGNLLSSRDVTLNHRAILGVCPYNPPVSDSTNAVIYLDSASGKLKVSEKGSAYQDLVSPFPFTIYTGTTSGTDYETVLSLPFAPNEIKLLRFQLFGVRTRSFVAGQTMDWTIKVYN